MANFKESLRPRARPSDASFIEASRLRKGEGSSLLKYPLNNQDDYGGTITFTAKTQEFSTLGSRALELFEGLGDVLGEETDPDDNREAAINSAKKSQVDTPTNELSQTALNNLGIGTGRKCTLYLPGAIQIQDKVSYNNNLDLGVIGSAVRQGLMSDASTGDIMRQAGQQISATFGSLVEAVRSGVVSETAQIAAMRVFGANSAVGGAISTATGVALNPNRRSMLSGPEIRTFGFTFRMIPTSAAEARAIKSIVQFFREEMYPDRIEQAGISAAYRYPSIFDITMRYRTAAGEYKKVATQLLPSYLQAVDVNYNQGSMAFHADGEPQETTMTLSFTEERTLTKADVATGGY